MKKSTVILFATVGILVFTLFGCSNGGTFTEKSYSRGENEIKKITIHVEDRELEIGASKDNQVYIDYFDGEKEYLDISVSKTKELTITMLYNKNCTDFIGIKSSAKYRKIKVKIPDNFIASFSASTTNENIKVSPLSFTENINRAPSFLQS